MSTPLTVPSETAAAGRPRLLDVTVLVYLVIALANLGVGIWTLSFVPAAVESLNRTSRPVPGGVLGFSIAMIGLATLLFSASLVFFALRLRRGSPWARPALLTVSLLALTPILIGGGPALLVVGALVVAAVLVTRAPISAWLRAKRGLPPA